jgi:hypothetical protein
VTYHRVGAQDGYSGWLVVLLHFGWLLVLERPSLRSLPL